MFKAALNNFYKLPIMAALFLLCVLFLPLMGWLDLWITGLFYDTEAQQFFWQDARPLARIYWLLAAIDAPLLLGLMALLAWSFYRKWETTKKKLLGFLLITLVLGPGLITNTWLKDNSIGRARPVHIVDFGGDRQFTPVLVQSGACERNCSFPSGHAAFGFYFMVLGWIFSSRRMVFYGVAIGCFESLGRIIQGGHFFSDVVFAFWVVFFTLVAISYLFRIPMPINPWWTINDVMPSKANEDNEKSQDTQDKNDST